MNSKPKYITSRDYRLLSLVPAPSGSQAVYIMDDGLECVPIFYTGVAEVTFRRYRVGPDGQRGQLVGEPLICNEVVGVEYDPQDGFSIADDADNFCGVAMPGEDITKMSYAVNNFDQHEKAIATHKEQQNTARKRNVFRGL